MAVYIKGKNGKLSDALAGLQAGLVQGFGMGQQARRTQLAERDQAAQEQRYRQQVEHANKLYELDVAQSRRADEDQAAQRQREADTRESTAALNEYATQEPITKEFGQGAGVFADLQAAQDAELARTAGIAKRITTPEAQRMFIQEQRAKMEDTQNQALVEHLKTRLTKAGASPLRSEGGELGHLGEERAAQLQQAQEMLDLATTPEARAKAVPLVSNLIGSIHMDDALELKRLRTVQRVSETAKQSIAQKMQLLDQARAIGEDPEAIADMEASIEAMEATAAMFEAAGGEIPVPLFMSQMAMARRAKATRPAAGSGSSGAGGGSQRGSWNQKDLYEAAVKSLQPEFMDTGAAGEQIPKAIPIERVRTRMREIENGQEMTPDIVPMGSVPSTTSQTAETPAIEVPQEVQMGAQEMYAKARETMSVEEAKKAIEVWIRSQVKPIEGGGDGVEAEGSLIRSRNKQPVSNPKKKEPVRTGAGEDYMRDPRIRAALATKPKPRE